jgi:hypothetical protein
MPVARSSATGIRERGVVKVGMVTARLYQQSRRAGADTFIVDLRLTMLQRGAPSTPRRFTSTVAA